MVCNASCGDGFSAAAARSAAVQCVYVTHYTAMADSASTARAATARRWYVTHCTATAQSAATARSVAGTAVVRNALHGDSIFGCDGACYGGAARWHVSHFVVMTYFEATVHPMWRCGGGREAFRGDGFQRRRYALWRHSGLALYVTQHSATARSSATARPVLRTERRLRVLALRSHSCVAPRS